MNEFGSFLCVLAIGYDACICVRVYVEACARVCMCIILNGSAYLLFGK